ncbi:acid protease [Cristinia sonorae]|uniref:Acid protease n=1 Tax=Cristinia sonorae TaxID=1940300 RepID=A0A8K0V089_9AGAR|nr:acid protease [Cristinia sonorae]
MKHLAPSFALYLCFLAQELLVSPANAFRVHGELKKKSELSSRSYGRLGRRVPMEGDLQNLGDLNYFANITLGNPPKQIRVLIDTGSSDLTVGDDVPGNQDSGKKADVNYAIGKVSGPIEFATLQFEGFTVPKQAYIKDTTGDQTAGQGIIGLGPNSGSVIQDVIPGNDGNTVLNNIFRTNTSTPNFITVLLGRSNDPTDLFPGDFTVGSVLDGFENITSMPKLPVNEVKTNNGQHWQASLDVNGTIGPDGQPIVLNSRVKGAGQKLVAAFDTGFSLPQVPRAMADAIYGRVPGAELKNLTGVGGGPIYTVPCDAELNITFVLGGVRIPIHPLDTVSDSLGRTDDLGNTICIGAFQPILPSAQSSTFDMLLGMAFLRNAYMLVNFGDFVDGSTKNTNDPYIQLLPITTDAAEAHSDFVSQRLGGLDSTADLQLLPASVLPDVNDGNPTDDNKSFSEKLRPYLPYIIAGSSALGALLIGSILWCCLSSRKPKYQPLHEPAPVGHANAPHQPPPYQSYQPQRRY